MSLISAAVGGGRRGGRELQPQNWWSHMEGYNASTGVLITAEMHMNLKQNEAQSAHVEIRIKTQVS